MPQELFKTSDELADAIIHRAKVPFRTGFRRSPGIAQRWFNMAAEAVINEAGAADMETDFELAETPNSFADRVIRAAQKAQNTERFR